ncbi:DUF1963 domain-containing protein [Actinospica durhamensis]|uniref:DUF1963 domain-containing protein n=1 Tax=Actinospica durhamensis TaxID=1508375 RepID=A0A941ER92_9ACTN|nr:DUF1963 domain-containing protein [Actinospica durhamensis]
MTSADEYARFARARLPEAFAEKWISLLRPAVQFPLAGAQGEPTALRLGGDPMLPDDVEWPSFEGYGPLSFIAELDCAAVAAVGGVGLLPESGHLSSFCVDERYEGPDKTVDYEWCLTEWTSGQVIYVPEARTRRPRLAPRWLEPYETDLRSARAVSTPPSTRWDLIERYFPTEVRTLADPAHPFWAEEFVSGIEALRETYAQCGGYARPCQGPPEVRAASAAIDAGRSPHINVLDEAAHWQVLLQIPEADDLGMIWGDSPVAYWMIRDDDLTTRRFDRTWFTMQN